jgi:sulfite exporter TauE/SafE
MSNLVMIAFLTGFAGSIHCIGMCGPLILSLPFNNYTRKEKTRVIILYHLGRVAAYGMLGMIAGFFGDALLLVGLGRWLSITVGIGLLLFLIHNKNKHTSIWGRGVTRLVNRIVRVGMLCGWKGFFMLGFGNGLLPCGMVYGALAIGVSAGSALSGLFVMIVFGLGTLPFILYFTLGSHLGIKRVRLFIQKQTFWIQFIIACVLVLRGLQLNIPYISPLSMSTKHGILVSCFK